MAVTKEILDSHSVATLKKEVAKTNIKGYSKMKKAEVIDLMLKNKEKFGHITKRESTAKPKSPPKSSPESAPKPKSKLEETLAEYKAVLDAEKKRRGIKEKPKKKAKKPKSNLPPAMIEAGDREGRDPDQYKFDYYYTGGASMTMNSYLNDLMDSKKDGTGRKLGITKVRAAAQKYLNERKKKGKRATSGKLKKHLEKLYADYITE